MPKKNIDEFDVFHIYPIRHKKRDELRSYLLKNGVKTEIHYPIPLHLQECAKSLGYKDGDIPNTELLAKSMISLPIFPLLENDEVDYVIENLNFIVNNLNKKTYYF